MPSPEPTISYFNDFDFLKDFEKEFPAIAYNNALTSKLDFLTEPIVSPRNIDEFDLKNETSLFECDEEEQNVLYFNDLFPFNVIYPDDSKPDKENNDDKIDIKHSSGGNVINTDDGAYAHGSNKLGETKIVRETTQKIIQIKHRLQASRDRQKSYADKRRKRLEFLVGDKVMLKVLPWIGVIRFGKRGKLNPRYIGPFKILAKVRTVSYRLELPEKLSHIHSTFHVSNLKKCLSDEPLAILLNEIHIDEKLNFIEEPVEIMDSKVKLLKQSHIPIVKVRWNSRKGPEYTWERKDQMQKKYPHLFANPESASQATSEALRTKLF
ncbi:hypothetical protein Tco_1245610 [Tanacetum coccineum]